MDSMWKSLSNNIKGSNSDENQADLSLERLSNAFDSLKDYKPETRVIISPKEYELWKKLGYIK